MKKDVKNIDSNESRLKTIFITSVVAILANIAIGIFKAIVGLVSNSIAITMDAINNFTDAGSSLVTLLSSYLAAKDPDKKHPFGYGRTEYLGTLLIAVLILYAGVTSFIESIKEIINPEVAEYSKTSMMIIIVAVIVKALLTFYITRAGKKVNSDSLIASGKESIGDVAISIATIVAALIYIYTDISIEAWLGAVIAALIIKAGLEILLETIGKLLGTGGDVELVKKIKKTIAEYDEVIGVYDVVLHNYGPESYLASVHLEVEDSLSMNEFDNLSRRAQEDILDKFGVYLSAVGVYSVSSKNKRFLEVKEDLQQMASKTQYVNQIHGLHIDDERKVLRFDSVISFDAKNRREVYNDFIEKIKTKYPEYSINSGMDSDYNEL